MSMHPEILVPLPPPPGSVLPANWMNLLDFYRPLAHERAHELNLPAHDCGLPVDEAGWCATCGLLDGHHGPNAEGWPLVVEQLGIPDAPERSLAEIVAERLAPTIYEDIGAWFTRTTLARIEALKTLPLHRILEVVQALDALETEWRAQDGAR